MLTIDIISAMLWVVNGLVGQEPGNFPRHVTAGIDSVHHVVIVTCHGVVKPDGI